jgi:predicted AlkP superfamily phosphohydrolase/phosphomutase
MAIPSNKVILLEFNELTPSLMNKFIDDGRLPNFKKFQSESEIFETMATEVSPDLEPWIQWVTLHTGLDYCDHKVFHLNEGHKLPAPRIWDRVSEHGMKSWVCGSMNVNASPGFNGLL